MVQLLLLQTMDPTRFQCDECSLTPSGRRTLFVHWNRAHCPSHRQSLFHCDDCSYSAIFQGPIERHWIPMHCRKPSSSIHCDFSTTYKGSMATHARVVHGPRTLMVCDDCPFATQQKGNMLTHWTAWVGLAGNLLRRLWPIRHHSQQPFHTLESLALDSAAAKPAAVHTCDLCDTILAGSLSHLVQNLLSKHKLWPLCIRL